MEITEEQYVNTQIEGGKVDKEKPKLAFAIPIKTKKDGSIQTSTLKRMKTVHAWRGGNYTDTTGKKMCATFKNEFSEGFKIVNYVSRHTTSNKWWEIEDPRGFILQISCENLLNILKEATIENGLIKGSFIWDTTGNLVSKNMIETWEKEHGVAAVQEHDKNRVKIKDVKIGSVISINKGSCHDVIYLGHYNQLYKNRNGKVGWSIGRVHFFQYVTSGNVFQKGSVKIEKVKELPFTEEMKEENVLARINDHFQNKKNLQLYYPLLVSKEKLDVNIVGEPGGKFDYLYKGEFIQNIKTSEIFISDSNTNFCRTGYYVVLRKLICAKNGLKFSDEKIEKFIAKNSGEFQKVKWDVEKCV